VCECVIVYVYYVSNCERRGVFLIYMSLCVYLVPKMCISNFVSLNVYECVILCVGLYVSKCVCLILCSNGVCLFL
jgi:hypothetical protein